MLTKIDSDEDRVHGWLRRLLTSGSLRPADSVSEKSIKNAMQTGEESVSTVSIRKTLARFEAEGIVRVIPQKGTIVCHINDEDLRQIWDSRVALEEFMIVQLARRRNLDLKSVTEIQDELGRCAHNVLGEIPTATERLEFMELDRQFHEAIGVAAGYPDIAEEIDILRLKIMIAGAVGTEKERMIETAKEHQVILAALGCVKSEPEGEYTQAVARPDINAVRLAYRIHMRNAAIKSWKIEQRIRPNLTLESYSHNAVLDIPEFLTLQDSCPDDATTKRLWQFREGLEIATIHHLAQNVTSIRRVIGHLRKLHDQSRLIINGLRNLDEGSEGYSEEQLNEFDRLDNIDISFHTAICFAGGALFGEEAIVFAWRKLRAGKQGAARALSDWTEMLKEHETILDCLENSRGSLKSAESARTSMQVHLQNAQARQGQKVD